MPIQHAIDELISNYKALVADGKLSWGEVLGFSYDVIKQIVALTETLPETGATKKAAALRAFEQFIDAVVTPIDLPYIPNIIEPAVDLTVKEALLLGAGRLVEWAVLWFNANGWPQE